MSFGQGLGYCCKIVVMTCASQNLWREQSSNPFQRLSFCFACMFSTLDIFETPVTVTPHQKNFKSLKIFKNSFSVGKRTFTFGERTFTFGERTFTFGEITFTFGGNNVYFWGKSGLSVFFLISLFCCWGVLGLRGSGAP